ncbi:MAG: FecR domain-containing protein [Chitinophagaceae bacterium]
MQPLDITTFLHRFAAGTNTEAEHQQFADWLKTAPLQEVAAALDQYNLILHDNISVTQRIDPSVALQIEAALDQYELGRPAEQVKVRRLPWRRFAGVAAAVLFLLVATTAIWIVTMKTPAGNLTLSGSKTILPQQNDLLPGGNKATLTLSNGSVISLDDAQTGKIALQGNTVINKSANGQLVYKALGSKHAEIVFNTLTTPRGGQFKLVLPDGSSVWLNAASSITYPASFTGDDRKVEIAGEAYFEIAHNPAKPFIVNVNGMEVKVLGTHFNINAYNDEAAIKTSLLQGSVMLHKGDNAVMLQPGQQAQLTADEKVKVVNDVDMDEVVAWKNGYFAFNRASLQSVMRQIARWYDVDISYEGKIPERLFGGKIDRNSNASEVLKILEESKVHFNIENKKITVRP